MRCSIEIFLAGQKQFCSRRGGIIGRDSESTAGKNFSKYQAFRRHWPLTRGADDGIYRKSFLYPVNGTFGKV
jgi:hypothetical protein